MIKNEKVNIDLEAAKAELEAAKAKTDKSSYEDIDWDAIAVNTHIELLKNNSKVANEAVGYMKDDGRVIIAIDFGFEKPIYKSLDLKKQSDDTIYTFEQVYNLSKKVKMSLEDTISACSKQRTKKDNKKLFKLHSCLNVIDAITFLRKAGMCDKDMLQFYKDCKNSDEATASGSELSALLSEELKEEVKEGYGNIPIEVPDCEVAIYPLHNIFVGDDKKVVQMYFTFFNEEHRKVFMKKNHNSYIYFAELSSNATADEAYKPHVNFLRIKAGK